ncbi:MAG: c-type cytochrome [Candidatus Eiseniibacteriota bacterium]
MHGAPLLVMPSPAFRAISDRDLAALIAFLRTQRASGQPTPPRRLNLLAYLVLGLHLFDDSVVAPVTWPVPDPPADSAVANGRYLTSYLGCRECHGPELRGGFANQLAPVGPDLVGFAAAHDSAAFELALGHGVQSDGRAMDPALMPWTTFSKLTDSEVGAIFEFLRASR